MLDPLLGAFQTIKKYLKQTKNNKKEKKTIRKHRNRRNKYSERNHSSFDSKYILETAYPT